MIASYLLRKVSGMSTQGSNLRLALFPRASEFIIRASSFEGALAQSNYLERKYKQGKYIIGQGK